MKYPRLISAAFLASATVATAQSVVFNQSFNYTAGKNGAITTEGDPDVIGWAGAFGPTGTALPFSNALDGFVGNYAWALSDGNFIYATNNDGASNPGAWMAYTSVLGVQYTDNTTTGYNTLNFYADVAGQVLTGKTYGELISLDAELRIPDASDIPARFALEVDLGGGPEWVVSDTPFTGTDNSYTLYALTTDAAAGWVQNAFTPGTFLANGITGASINISDTAVITAYGIYFDVPDSFVNGGTGTDSSSVRFRMREYNITAVPEPSTFALVAGVLAFGVLITRRRRS